MKKQLLIIGGGIASFWSTVTAFLQSFDVLSINLLTEKNSKMSNFLTPVDTDLTHKGTGSFPDQFNNNLKHTDSSPWLEETSAPFTPDMDWMDEDTSQGGEFLDDALRIKDQPLRLHK